MPAPNATKQPLYFDAEAARQAGYSDDELLDFLSKGTPNFDVTAAQKAGYSKAEIIDRLGHSVPPLPPGFAPNLPSKGAPASGPWTAFQQKGATEQGPWTQFQRAQPADQFGHPPIPDGFVLENQNAGDAPVTAGGLAKAAGAGVVKGTVDLPADVVSLLNLARRGYTSLTGGSYDPAKDDYSLGRTYDAARTAADNLYQPKNAAEDWTKWGATFAPALIGGPEDLALLGPVDAAKVLAKRAAARAAIPAAASDVAGTVTQGTELEPYARAGAGLLAGGLAVKGERVPPISSDTVAAAAKRDFDAFRAAPVEIDPNVVSRAARNIQSDLSAAGLGTAPANNYVASYLSGSKPVTLNQLQETRALLGKAASSDSPEGVAAVRAKAAIDDLMSNLTPADTVSGAGALPGAMDALKRGRINASVQNQLEMLEGAQNKGEINANLSESANTMRSQIASLLKSKQAMRKLAPYQQDMNNIVQGNAATNAARWAGNKLGYDSHWWLAPLLFEPVSTAGSIASAVTLPLVGSALRKYANNQTISRVNALMNKVGSQAQGLPAQPAPFNPWLTRGLIGTLAANPTRQ